MHVLPVTNENVTSFFQGHIYITKRSHFLPDTKPDLQEPQFAFTRQTHITKNKNMYFPVTCRKWILKEMSVTSRECLHNIVIQISDNILYVNSDIPLQKLRCTLCYLV